MPTPLAGDLKGQIDAIEESYEFFLAYAAQGHLDDRSSHTGGQVRQYLARADAALGEIAGAFRALVAERRLEPVARYEAFLEVLERDARAARAAVQLVLAQSSIGSQLVDNLNASSHVRALLTDLFLLDDIVKARAAEASPVQEA